MRAFRYGCFIVFLSLPATLQAQPIFTEVTAGDLTTIVPGWSVSWVDYDGDGDPDLFASRSSNDDGSVPTVGNALFRNDDGTFVAVDADTLTTGPGSIGHSWADVDNDGDLDALVVGGTGFQGPGTFGDTGSGARFFLNMGSDSDGEGWAFEAVEAAPFTSGDENEGWTGTWADYDNDGLLDFVIAHPAGFVTNPSQTNHLFRQVESTGDTPAFERIEDGPIVTGLAPYTVASWSDYDQDGDADLFIGSGPANGTAVPDNLYRNLLVEDGTASFERITTDPIATTGHDGQVMNWVDYDNDGDFDLYVTNYSGATNKLYRNDSDDGGAGPFVEVIDTPLNDRVDAVSLANTWGDVDNDGDLDVFVAVQRTAAPNTGHNRLYLNNGDGTFSTAAEGPGVNVIESTTGATFGDYDGDGDLDLATNDPGARPVRLFRNDTDNSNNWVKLDLVGVASNRSGIGAKVRATATISGTSVTQLREVSTQNTFNGQNDLTVHFGLGDATSADIRVEWPSGAVDMLAVNAGTRTQITEGQQPVDAEEGAVSAVALTFDGAYPNPFASTTKIAYTVPSGHVRLTVHDLLGRRVTTLVDHTHTAGAFDVTWDGTGTGGRALSAGLYVLRLNVNGASSSRRISIVR